MKSKKRNTLQRLTGIQALAYLEQISVNKWKENSAKIFNKLLNSCGIGKNIEHFGTTHEKEMPTSYHALMINKQN